MFEGFPVEGVSEFYKQMLRLRPVRHFHIHDIWIIRTYRGKPRRRMNCKDKDGFEASTLWTGAGACGIRCIVEKVHFRLYYRNISYKHTYFREGLYLRGLVSDDNRTGGAKIIWRR